jgi:hypothetical protein
MKNDNDADNMAKKQEEIELIQMVYPDLVKIVGTNRIQVKLVFDIEIIFRLPPGYPTRLVNFYGILIFYSCLVAHPNIKSLYRPT